MELTTAQSMEQEAERLEGAVWGHLAGDALGVPYEFRPPGAIGEVVFGASGTHGRRPGTWSDDGALMLALLDSLVPPASDAGALLSDPGGTPRPTAGTPSFDLADQARRIRAWHEDGAYTPDGDGAFDVGNATLAAIRALRDGVPPERSGSTLSHALGSGSLMRILPVALAGRRENEEILAARASAASAVTHGEPLSRIACALYVLVAVRLLRDPDDVDGALTGAQAALRAIVRGADLEPALDQLDSWERRTGGGHVADAFWSAWDAVAGATTYREAIVAAVRYGNDTDTTAAIAGGLAGIRWGIDGIPAEWLARMRGREVAGPLVDRLLATAGWRTSTANPLRVDWVAAVDLAMPGALGMTLLPGKRDRGIGGAHWRDPVADARRLRDVHGCDTFLLLVEDVDLGLCRASATVPALEAAGIGVIRHPVPDGGVPADPAAFRATLDNVAGRLRVGERVVVACRGGLGRTGTAVACLLVDGGLAPERAIERVRAARRGTIETRVQEEFVRGWRSGPGPVADGTSAVSGPEASS